MRFYDVDGDRFPSVTTIINTTMSVLPRFYLDRHYAKGPVSFRSNEASQLRGNLTDLWIKAYLKGDRLPEADWHIQEYCNRVRPTLDDLKMNSGCSTDLVVAHRGLRYAGTIDVLIQRPNQMTVWEFKTKTTDHLSPDAMNDALLQTAAYVAAARDEGMLVTDGAVCFILKYAIQIHYLEGDTLESFVKQFQDRVKVFGIPA